MTEHILATTAILAAAMIMLVYWRVCGDDVELFGD
jgi:hypothetical protein